VDDNLDKIFYRIICGYFFIFIDNIKYKIINPSIHIKYEAEILYDEIIEDNKYDKRWMTENEINLYLELNNIWNKQNEKQLKQLEKLIEDFKIELFLNFTDEKKRTFFRKQLSQTRKNIDELYKNKNCMSHLDIKTHAMSVKNEFILMNTIYDMNNNLVFKNPYSESLEYKKLQLFIAEILDYNITPQIIRKLVKTDFWKSYTAVINLTMDLDKISDDYRHLISLHKMYDNVRQHPECPSDQIIEDDDALDGWFLHQNRKIEKEKKKNTILNKFGGNIKEKAGEVFVMSQDLEEVKDIYDLNNPEQKQNIRELIIAAQNNKDGIKWQDLPYVQRQIRQQANEQFKEKVK
jgi:hypothetical protein